MKILVTGFTAKQRGHGRPRIFLLLDAVALALQSLGHEVTRTGNFLPGDPLVDEHDAIIVGVYSYNSIAAFGSKVAMVEACTRKPYVLAWDDYHSREVFGSISAGPPSLWRPGPMEGTDKWDVIEAEAAPRRQRINELAMTWADQIPNCLVAAFDWGNHDILAAQHSFGSLLPWDPSPWITDWYSQVDDAEKQREWVMATLSNYDAWTELLSLKWPVMNIAKPKGTRTREWQLEEQEVFDTYCRSWGVLSPPYEHLLGSGWWRNRFALSTLAGSILLCDHDEIKPLKSSWYYTNEVDIERRDDMGLACLADAQHEEFWSKWVMPREASAQKLEQWLLGAWK